MFRNYVGFIIFFLAQFCVGYNKYPNQKNHLKTLKDNLKQNIEIYESIKECNVSELNTCGDLCPLCLGTKVLLCNYCQGTGFLTIGDVIIGTGNNCTVCMGKGETECGRCKGAGYIAKWRK
tara:strand:+ start:1704 stop:2066 length:363 start_codon:yes stop_codon:yes gene_type:complete